MQGLPTKGAKATEARNLAALSHWTKATPGLDEFRRSIDAGTAYWTRTLRAVSLEEPRSSREIALSDRDDERAVRAAAYYQRVREGRPEGRALDHWLRAKSKSGHSDEVLLEKQEKVVNGQPADMQAIMTNDARGG